jgi:hypothetical protein
VGIMPATLGIDDIDDPRTPLRRFRTDFGPGALQRHRGRPAPPSPLS